MLYGLASWLNGKESAGDPRATGSVAGSRGGNGNLHQYSCLENSMDREAWQATVHGVTRSQTGQSTFTHRDVKYYIINIMYIVYETYVTLKVLYAITYAVYENVKGVNHKGFYHKKKFFLFNFVSI